MIVLAVAFVLSGGAGYRTVVGEDQRRTDLSMYLSGAGSYQRGGFKDTVAVVLENSGEVGSLYTWSVVWKGSGFEDMSDPIASGDIFVAGGGRSTVLVPAPAESMDKWAIFTVKGSSARLQWRWEGVE